MASAIRAHPAAFGFGPAVHGGKILWNTGIDQYKTGSHGAGHLIPRNATKLPAQKAESIAAFDAFIRANDLGQVRRTSDSGKPERRNPASPAPSCWAG